MGIKQLQPQRRSLALASFKSSALLASGVGKVGPKTKPGTGTGVGCGNTYWYCMGMGWYGYLVQVHGTSMGTCYGYNRWVPVPYRTEIAAEIAAVSAAVSTGFSKHYQTFYVKTWCVDMVRWVRYMVQYPNPTPVPNLSPYPTRTQHPYPTPVPIWLISLFVEVSNLFRWHTPCHSRVFFRRCIGQTRNIGAAIYKWVSQFLISATAVNTRFGHREESWGLVFVPESQFAAASCEAWSWEPCDSNGPDRFKACQIRRGCRNFCAHHGCKRVEPSPLNQPVGSVRGVRTPV